MAKKKVKNTEVLENTETRETPIVMTTAQALKDSFESFPNVTIRKFAQAAELNYMGLLNASRKPIVGEAYDPSKRNYAEMARIVDAKGVNIDELDWAEMEKSNRVSTATLVKDVNAFNVGDKVYIRREPTTPYEIVYKTESHIVMILEGTTEPIAWKLSTFLLNGPQFTPRAPKAEAEAEVADEATEA